MSLLNYDAINLAEKDLQYGREFLEKKQSELSLPFISANVYNYGTEKLFAKPYIIKQVGDLRLGIFGVTTNSRVAQNLVKPASGFEIKDPVIIAQALVPVLKKQCDVVIALAHLSLRGAKDLAEKVEGIDIIISGHDRSVVRQPVKIGKTIIMQPGAQGKYLGHLEFEFVSNEVNVTLGKAVALNDKIPDDKPLADLVAEYDKDLLNLFPMESEIALEDYSKLSERSCLGCHRKEYQRWSATPHKRAWQSLVDKGQTNDPDCHQCHTTLFNEPNGFTSVYKTPYLVNVQCAECHQLAGGRIEEHIAKFKDRRFSANSETNGQVKPDFKPVSQENCVKCHTEDNTPNLNFVELLERVKH